MSLSLALRKLESGVLQIQQRLTECLSLLHVTRGDFHGAFRCNDCAKADRQPLVAELIHHLEQPAAFAWAQQISNRNTHAIEEQLASVLSVSADLLERAANPVAGHVPGLDHQQRERLRARRLGVGPHGEADEARLPAVRDECLGAVDHIVIAIPSGGGLDALQVRTGIGLRQPDRADKLAAGHARKPAVPLLFAAVGEDVVSHNALDAETEVDAASGELLDDDGLVGKSPASAAIFLGYVREQQSDLARLNPSLGIRVTLLSPTRVVGRKLHFDKLANRLLKDPRLVGHPGRFVCHDFGLELQPWAAELPAIPHQKQRYPSAESLTHPLGCYDAASATPLARVPFPTFRWSHT